MRSIITIFIVLALLSFRQSETRTIPSADIKTVNGKIINTSVFSNSGKPYLIAFFATWCKPCKDELNAISEVYADWQKETGVKVIAVSIDDSKTSSKISSFVNANSWDFEVYHDYNMDFKRALNVQCSPHIFLVDGSNHIVWERNTYHEGDEEVIYKKIKEYILK